MLDKVYTIDSLTVFYDEDGKIDLDKTKDSFVPGNNFPKGAQISSVGENCFTITDSKGFEITLDIPNKEVIRSSDANVEVLSCSKPLPAADGDYVITSLEVTYDANGKLDTTTPPAFTPGNNFPADATASYDGNMVKITSPTDDPDFEMYIRVPENGLAGQQEVAPNVSISYTENEVSYKNLEIDITGIGAMDTQIGANEGQILEIRVPTMTLQRLGITGAEVTTEDKSADANVAIKGAIAYVSDARSRLGAYQNRLEHTVGSLDITNENMTASYSRIMDVDVSEEMTYYTSQQVVEQAAISMLAQANERPSQVLQLLQ